MQDVKLTMNNILYEDNHIIVVVKEKNIPVQEDDTKDLDLLTMIKSYLKEKYQKPGNVYLGLVHRLDRPVRGIMVFAKTSKAAARLSEQVRTREIKKCYHAVVDGIAKPSDCLEDYLIKDEKTNISRVTDAKHGKKAILSYETLKVKNNQSLVKINLETGRSHQIRVQFASRHLPLNGDQKYNSKAVPGTQIALIASELTFVHPTTKELMNFKIDLPNELPWNIF